MSLMRDELPVEFFEEIGEVTFEDVVCSSPTAAISGVQARSRSPSRSIEKVGDEVAGGCNRSTWPGHQ